MSKVTRAQTVVEEDRTCPECDSTHLVIDDVRGELVCDDCGLVLQDHAVDPSPEWTAYAPADARRLAHTGAPRDPLSGPSGLTTVIPSPHRDANGNSIPFEGRGALYRIQRLQRHASHALPGERSIPEAARVLDRLVSALDLPRNVRDEAGFLCRKAIQRQLARGRSIEVLVAGAVYAACRIEGVPRTLDEIQKVTGIARTRVGAAYRSLHRELALAVHASHPADYIQRFCSELELSNRVEQEALTLLRQFESPGTPTSVSPCGTAGAAIYLAGLVCGELRSEKAIAKVAGVSEVTLRNRYLEMKALLPGVESPRGRTRSPLVRRA
jgi:transcription initiation factor TFIIB